MHSIEYSVTKDEPDVLDDRAAEAMSGCASGPELILRLSALAPGRQLAFQELRRLMYAASRRPTFAVALAEALSGPSQLDDAASETYCGEDALLASAFAGGRNSTPPRRRYKAVDYLAQNVFLWEDKSGVLAVYDAVAAKLGLPPGSEPPAVRRARKVARR